MIKKESIVNGVVIATTVTAGFLSDSFLLQGIVGNIGATLITDAVIRKQVSLIEKWGRTREVPDEPIYLALQRAISTVLDPKDVISAFKLSEEYAKISSRSPKLAKDAISELKQFCKSATEMGSELLMLPDAHEIALLDWGQVQAQSIGYQNSPTLFHQARVQQLQHYFDNLNTSLPLSNFVAHYFDPEKLVKQFEAELVRDEYAHRQYEHNLYRSQMRKEAERVEWQQEQSEQSREIMEMIRTSDMDRQEQYNELDEKITQITPSSRHNRGTFDPIIPAIDKTKFFGRTDDLNTICQHLTSSPLQLSTSRIISCVYGMGGIGKSTLLLHVYHHPEVKKHYNDRIIWLELGKDFSIVDQYQKILNTIGEDSHIVTERSLIKSKEKIDRWIKEQGQPLLLVLDDVWESEHLEQFFFVTSCHIIFSSRRIQIARKHDAKEFLIETLSKSASKQFLEKVTGTSSNRFAEIAEYCGYLPLALELTAQSLRNDYTPERWLARFRNKPSRLGQGGDQGLQNCFALSVDVFHKEEERRLFYSLAIFLEGGQTLDTVIIQYWKQLDQDKFIDQNEFIDHDILMERFVNSSLLTRTRTGQVSMHMLIHDYIEKKIEATFAAHHALFLKSYNPNDKVWYSADIKYDAYLYRNFLHHIRGANQESMLFGQFFGEPDAPDWINERFKKPEIELENLFVDVWQAYYEAHEQEAEQFICQKWLARTDYVEGEYSPQVIAARCAVVSNVKPAIVDTFCHQNVQIRLISLNNLYKVRTQTKGRDDILSVIKLLEAEVSKPENRWQKMLRLPNVTALQSLFALCILMSVHYYRPAVRDSDPDKTFESILATMRLIIKETTGGKLVRLGLGTLNSSVFSKLAYNIVMNPSKDVAPKSVNNLPLLEKFFTLEPHKREIVYQVLPYLDPRYGQTSDIEDPLESLYFNGDRVSTVLAEFIINARGLHNPKDVEPILNRLYRPSSQDPGNLFVLSTSHLLYSIMEGTEAKKIDANVMKQMATYTESWLDRSGDDDLLYGQIRCNDSEEVQYYPLAYYMSLWMQAEGRIGENLFEKYSQEALKNEDVPLMLHVIDTLTDLRQVFDNYRDMLKSLIPYIERVADPSATSEADQKIRDQLVVSLGTLYSQRLEEIEKFLDDYNAPSDLVTQIRSYSYRHPSEAVYIRSYQLLVMILAYSKPESINRIVSIAQKALRSPSMEDAIYITLKELRAIVDKM